MYHSNKCFANTMKHYQLLSMFLSCMPRPFMKVEAKAFCDTSVDLVSVDSGLQSVYMICFSQCQAHTFFSCMLKADHTVS